MICNAGCQFLKFGRILTYPSKDDLVIPYLAATWQSLLQSLYSSLALRILAILPASLFAFSAGSLSVVLSFLGLGIVRHLKENKKKHGCDAYSFIGKKQARLDIKIRNLTYSGRVGTFCKPVPTLPSEPCLTAEM